ncbi:MAG TPA: ABC transporter permease [Thermomicrobiaceae bacterium]|nr:ABC transporter permease [Chloroflexota bacterium]HLI50972.1 ABC transporter permease [Thermomicrobiaceae bacterium]
MAETRAVGDSAAASPQPATATGAAPRRRGHLTPALIRLGSLVVVLVVWEIYGRSVNPVLFTYPTAVFQAFVELTTSGELWQYLQQSILVLLFGFASAVLVGIPLGVAMARYKWLDYAIDTYINALYSMPMVAIVPLLVLWFGFDLKAKTVVVFLFCLFPVLISTYQGVKSVDPRLLEVARSFRSGEAQLWSDLIIPSALPFIIAGLRLAIGRGLVGLVIAEFYTSIAGLGYMIVKYANSFQTDKLFVPIVVLMVLGVVLMEALKQLQGRMAPWLRQIDEE